MVGERTYGKGSVQNVVPFAGGQMKLTTASFWPGITVNGLPTVINEQTATVNVTVAASAPAGGESDDYLGMSVKVSVQRRR